MTVAQGPRGKQGHGEVALDSQLTDLLATAFVDILTEPFLKFLFHVFFHLSKVTKSNKYGALTKSKHRHRVDGGRG